MMTERDIFLGALEMTTPEARVAYLQVACGHNADLLRKVDELLKEHFSDDTLLAGSALEGTRDSKVRPPVPEAPAQMIGRYKLLEMIGEGGFGEVWMADQREPVKRRVAIKIVKPGMDSRQIVARFEAERQALAMMDHPNIAKIFDAGTTDASRPFFVMELVRGIKITEYCDQNQLPTRERLRLFILVCQAIQHAHQKGIIHRDIKPSNILVTRHDGVPVPKLIDFGIAKATQQALTDQTVFTHFQQFVGTPAYISPEQAEMSGLDVDTRADIYSLGVLLYELLVSQTPFDAKEMLGGGLDSMRKIIREKEPLRPSTRLNTLPGEARTTAAERRQTAVARLVHQLRGDLDWIVMKCLEKDRTRRYDTANGLAADIQRHLANEPVTARPPSAAYRFQKAWRRNRLAWTAAALVAVALAIGIAVSSRQARVASRARQQAEDARTAEAEQRLAAQRAEALSEAERAKAQRAAEDRLDNLYAADIRVAYQALQANDFALAKDSISKYRSYLPGASGGTGPSSPADGSSRELLGWEWRYLWQLCRSDELLTLQSASNQVHRAVLAPHGAFLVSASDRWLRVMDQNSKQVLATLGGPEEFDDFIDTGAVAFSADGRYLAAKGGTSVRVWQVGQWEAPYKRMQGLGNSSMNSAVVFSPDSRTLATRVSGGIGFWDTGTWEMRLFPGPERLGVLLKYSRDGTMLAMDLMDLSTDVHGLQIRNANTLALITNLERRHSGDAWVLAADFSDSLLALGYRDGALKLFDLATWAEVVSVPAHPSFVFGMAFSPDGRLLATGGTDQVIRIWDTTNPAAYIGSDPPPKPIKELRGHQGSLFALAFAPDGKQLFSASRDGTVKVWDPLGAVLPAGLPDQHKAVWFSPDAREVITRADGQLTRWNTTDRRKVGPAVPPTEDRRYAIGTVSGDGRMAALGSAEGVIDVWNLQTGSREVRLEAGVEVWNHELAFSPSGGWLAAAPAMIHHSTSEGGLRLWNLESSTPSPRLFPYAYAPLAFCSDGRRLVSVKKDGIVQVSDFRTAVLLAHWKAHAAPIHSLALSPDDRWLATGAEDAVVRVWDMASGEQRFALKGHLTGIPAMAFAPDGKTLVTVSWDSTVKFWHLATGRELFTVDQFRRVGFSARFSPNGGYLAVSGDDGSSQPKLMLWHAPSWEEIAAAEAMEK